MVKLKSSSEDFNDTTSKVLSGIWKVVWFTIRWCFWIAMAFMFAVIGFAFALGGVRLPNLPDFPKPKPNSDSDPEIDPDIDPNREWEKAKEKTSDEIIEEINNIEPSTSKEYRIFQKLQNSRGQRLKDISLSKKSGLYFLSFF